MQGCMQGNLGQEKLKLDLTYAQPQVGYKI
jgi:hypothetical protein